MILERPSCMHAPRREEGSRTSTQLDVFNAWEGLGHNYPILTVDQAARELHCSDQHIRNFIQEGKLIAFFINVEMAQPKRRHYCILRQSAATAFTFIPSAQRLQAIHEAIANVDTWLFKPFSDAPETHWLDCLRIGQRANLTILETAAALGECAGSHIRNLVTARQLTPTNISTNQQAGPQTLRIQRRSLVTFVQIRLARQNNINL